MEITRARAVIRGFVFTYLVYVVSRWRRSLIARTLSWATLAYQKAIGNCSFDMRLNGERRVLELLANDTSFVTLFDVGANRGEWTRVAREMFPAAMIHCFELAPPTFAILRRNVSSDACVVLNDFGLSSTKSKIRIAFAPGNDGLTSMLSPEGMPGTMQIEANTQAGDDYVASAGVERIDFLKVDVEGAEPFVFAGFERSLAAGSIRVIQFEHGHSRSTLREFYDKFESFDYIVGKIFPDGCVFDGYRAEREPVASNYVAVRAGEEKILEALRVES